MPLLAVSVADGRRLSNQLDVVELACTVWRGPVPMCLAAPMTSNRSSFAGWPSGAERTARL